MALICCPECNREISDKAKICPNCGYPIADIEDIHTSKTNNSSANETIENLYLLARRAKDNDEYELASKYYESISISNPNDWESVFYSLYFKSLNCKVADIFTSIISLTNHTEIVIKLIKEYISDLNIATAAISEIIEKCKTATDIFINGANAFTSVTADPALLDSSNVKKAGDYIYKNRLLSIELLYCLGNYIEIYFKDNSSIYGLAIELWKYAINKHMTILIPFINDAEVQKNQANIQTYYKKINEFDNDYTLPEVPKSSGGCYIATAVYGSYDCPQVWTLRRYRDNTLAATWYGRAFIHTYYAVSPTIVKWFGNTQWFKKILKTKLDKMVSNLKSIGIDDTPYQDQKWR